ncbi:MAG TPA: AMP-binding protein, partial [Anaerolineales bacterium]
MTTIAGHLLALSEKDPGRTAIYLQRAGQPDLPISYGRLMAGATAYSHAFTAEGMQPGEVIVLILQHGEELIYAFWGAILCGAIPSIMPFLTEKLSPERYRADLAALVAVTRPAAIVTYAEFEGEVHKALSGDSPVRKVFVVERVQPQVNPDQASPPGLMRNPGDIALLQHSSGTTGLQKGVALSHTAVFNQLNSYSKALDLNEQDVIVSWLPLYHDMGLIAGFLMPILTAVPLVLSSPFDWVRAPHRLLQSVTEYKGSLTWLPNFAFNFL